MEIKFLSESGKYPHIEINDEQDKSKLVPQRLFQACIFSFLKLKDLCACSLVNKKWNQAVKSLLVQEAEELDYIIGPKKWGKYIGKVDEEPIPDKIMDFIKKNCPYNPEKKAYKTHQVVYIPKEINGASFTLNIFEKYIQYPMNKGNPSSSRYVRKDIRKFFNNNPIGESYWFAMTKDPIPNSQGKGIEEQKKLLKDGDKIPTVFEAVVCILMTYICSEDKKLFLYHKNSSKFMRCKGVNEDYAAGAFDEEGLWNDWCPLNADCISAAALRRLDF